MADLSDVEGAICDLVASVLYPGGLAGPLPQVPVKIYAGWPDKVTLDEDLPADRPARAFHISVFGAKTERNTTRAARREHQGPRKAPTYGISVAGQVVTVTGAAPAPYHPQNLAVFVNGVPYVVQATDGQSSSQVAAALHALIAVDVMAATVLGSAITLPPEARIGALRVGTTAESRREVRCQEKAFRISIWSNTPESRDELAKSVDPVLADTPFLTYADGSVGRFNYISSENVDRDQRQGLYRRELLYLAEWSTIRVETRTEIVSVTENLRSTDGALIKSINL